MKNQFRTYQASGGGLLEAYRPPGLTGFNGARSFIRERDELEKELEEKAAELARVKDALQGEIAKRESAEQALREAKENFEILMDYAHEGVQIIQSTRNQFQESAMQRTRGKTLITAFLHDLKGPLALISSCAQFCMDNFPHLPSLEKNLKIIYESGQRAIDLAKKFLEVFEYHMLVIEPVNINGVVAKAWRDAQQNTQALQVSFETSLAQEFPEVMGNIEGLERVFFNLFLNAIQAVSRKRGKVVVETHLLSSENMVEVDVLDNGRGIPEEHRQRIFEPFFTTKEEGTGLGLSLCQAIVKQHQGSIYVDCLPEGGTRFSVKLPVGQSSFGAQPPTRS